MWPCWRVSVIGDRLWGFEWPVPFSVCLCLTLTDEDVGSSLFLLPYLAVPPGSITLWIHSPIKHVPSQAPLVTVLGSVEPHPLLLRSNLLVTWLSAFSRTPPTPHNDQSFSRVLPCRILYFCLTHTTLEIAFPVPRELPRTIWNIAIRKIGAARGNWSHSVWFQLVVSLAGSGTASAHASVGISRLGKLRWETPS